MHQDEQYATGTALMLAMSIVNDPRGGGESYERDGGSGVVGRRGNPINIEPGTNVATEIDGVRYTGHALDRMQGYGIPRSAVKNTIDFGSAEPGYDGATVYYDSVNDMTVVCNPDGSVKTVYYGS